MTTHLQYKLILSLFVCGFSLTSQAQERASAATVSIAPLIIQDDAYRTPNVIWGHSSGIAQQGPIDGVLMVIGKGIYSGVSQANYDNKNNVTYAKLQDKIEKAFKDGLETNFRNALSNNVRVKNLIDGNSANILSLKITNYGLRRNDESPQDRPNLSLYIQSEAKTISANGEVLTSRTYNTYSNKSGELSAYLNDVNFTKDIVLNTQEKLANQIAIELYVQSMKKVK